jgi:hypothetical protein
MRDSKICFYIKAALDYDNIWNTDMDYKDPIYNLDPGFYLGLWNLKNNEIIIALSW